MSPCLHRGRRAHAVGGAFISRVGCGPTVGPVKGMGSKAAAGAAGAGMDALVREATHPHIQDETHGQE